MEFSEDNHNPYYQSMPDIKVIFVEPVESSSHDSAHNPDSQILDGREATLDAGTNTNLELPAASEKENLLSKEEKHSDPECRICQSHGEESLISPCKCAGSTKWVHESCLVLWFQVSHTSTCELCSQKIIVKKHTKPVREWRRPNGRSFGPCSKVDLWYLFVTVFSLGTIIGFGVFQACVGTKETETTIVFTAIYVLCALMIVVRIRYFYQWFTRRSFFWEKWRRLNQHWFIFSDGPSQEAQKVALEMPSFELQQVMSVDPCEKVPLDMPSFELQQVISVDPCEVPSSEQPDQHVV